MAKLPAFPIEIRAGGFTIRIFRDPLRIPVKPQAPADPAQPAQFRNYDSYVVQYYEGRRRIRIRRNSYEKARMMADEIRVKLLNQDVEALQLNGRDRRVYLAALDNLKGLDVPLDHVTQEYATVQRQLEPHGLLLPNAISQLVEALDRLGGAALSTVLDFYEQHGRKIKAGTVPQVVAKLVEGLKQDKKGDYHIRDMTLRLGRFAEAFPGPIGELTTAGIDEWLRGLHSASPHGDKTAAISGKTRNNYRNAVVQLLNFARANHYLPRDLRTAAELTKLVDHVAQENLIFTPLEMTRLLAEAPERLIPGLAIKAFSGVRTEEVAAMEWSAIRFDQDCIILPATITKLRQRRLIALKPNLKAWLEPHRQVSGRVCADWATPQSVFHAWERHAKRIGLVIGANRFRNSFISYRLAETKNINLVASESGNSPQTIRRDYLEVTTPQEAEKWFAIFPAKPTPPPAAEALVPKSRRSARGRSPNTPQA